VHPEEGSYIVKAVCLTEDHADEEEQDSDLIECLVRAETIVCALIEDLLASGAVDRGVDDPILGHVPLVVDCHVKQGVESEHQNAGEECLELT